LFCELLLLFSIFSAFFICQFFCRTTSNSDDFFLPGQQIHGRYWLENYRLFTFFLNHKYPLNPDQKQGSSDRASSRDLKKRLEAISTEQPRILIDFLKLKYSQQLLDEKKFVEFRTVMKKSDNSYTFLNHKHNKLILEYLYTLKKYPLYIEQFENHPVDEIALKVQYLDCLLKTGKSKQAFQVFKTLFFRNRVSAFTDRINRQVLRKLISRLDFQYWVEKFSYLAEMNAFREIFLERKYVKSVQLANLFYAENHYRRRRFKKAESLLSRINRKELLPRKKKLLFKINLRTTRNDFGDIIQGLEELKEHKRIFPALLFNSANILLMKEETRFALKLYNQYIISSLGVHNSDFWKALWISAWIRLKKNQKKEAVRYFNLGKNSPIIPYKVANSYWVSRMDNKTSRVVENYPFSYYFTKTVDFEKRETSHIKLKNFIRLVNQDQNPILMDIIRGLKYLIRNQLVEESLQLIQLVKQEKNFSQSNLNVILLIESIIHLKRNDYYQAFKKFKDNFECYECIQLPTFLSEIYLPVKFQNLIEKYSQQHDLDPFLILALIREESFFKTDAVSTARAYGLMQILLGTAREVAKKRIRRQELFEPDTNIRLGTKYLKYLVNKYNGKIHLALAAYNAGDFRVDRWIERFGYAPDDEFIEMIPITATRTYVKNIYRNYFYYKLYHRKHIGIQ
jgi:hypothetical protein